MTELETLRIRLSEVNKLLNQYAKQMNRLNLVLTYKPEDKILFDEFARVSYLVDRISQTADTIKERIATCNRSTQESLKFQQTMKHSSTQTK